ncbi:uncharacterized protein LOC122534065 isoform X1 [Frieseomelitta varia]|uniref:uncharacterized protein LOC122534065 isoform X1 n=1 Tax=Frieseomelitta varia TaxID=561572 RepID=UPI001CB69F79|nr:uncharacterized protein LOC122534065 isoform X1 [Frieseomelitta varia]
MLLASTYLILTMIFKLISFLVFLSLAARFSVSEHVARNDSPVLHDARTDPNNFVLVNPSQVRRLERTIRNFFSKMSEVTEEPAALKSKSSNSYNLLSTVREICKSIRERLVQLAHDVGLINTVRRYEKSSNAAPMSDDWYSESLLQSVYMIRDLGNVINEIRSSTGLYIEEGNATSREGSKQLSRQANGFKFLGVVHDIADYSDRLFQCLLEMMDTRKHGASSLSLNRAIFRLAKQSPKATVETLKITARNTSQANLLKNHPRQKSWHVYLCLSMLNEGIDFNDCVRELQRFDECANSSRQPSSAGTRNSDVKSWTRAIRSLSDCKILVDKYGETMVSCHTDRKIPMRIERKARYVFEKMLGKKISKGSPFYRAAGDLGDTLSKSELGQRFVDELCQYVRIYEDGQRKLKRLSKSVHRDRRAMVKHGEISKALKLYKRGALVRTFGAINKMHHSAIDFEKFFAEGMKDTLTEAWQSHVRILSSLMDWMTKLLELHNGGSFSGKEPSSSDTSTSQVEWNSDENSNSENMQELVARATRPRSEMIKDVDSSMNSLIESMNHLTRHRNASNKNTLTCIANNLLLVMIFMETIGFVSSLYCLGHSTNDQTSSEFDDEWNRERRSLVAAEYDEIVDLISRDYLLLDRNSAIFERKRKHNKNSK